MYGIRFCISQTYQISSLQHFRKILAVCDRAPSFNLSAVLVFSIEDIPGRWICRWIALYVPMDCYVWDFLIRLIVINAGNVEIY
jgi:hypothetical protein